MRRLGVGLLVVVGVLAAVAAAVPAVRRHVGAWAAGDPVVEGQPVRYWLEQARTGDPADKEKAYQVLGDLAQAAPAGTAEAIAAGLTDPERGVRRSAAYALSRVPDGAAHAGPLVAALTDPEIEVRSAATTSLGSMQAGGPEAVTALMRAAKEDSSGSVRLSALYALARYGRQAEPAMPLFLDALTGSDGPSGSPQQTAVAGLVAAGPVAVAPLTAALAQPSVQGRKGAVRALTALGPAAVSALPELRRLTGPGEPDAMVRLLAVKAVATLDNNPALLVAAARDGLTYQSPDPAAQQQVRMSASHLLGELGPAAATALPAVLATLAGDPDHQVRRFAALAAGKIDGGEAVRAALVKATKDDQPEVCHAANTALQALDRH